MARPWFAVGVLALVLGGCANRGGSDRPSTTLTEHQRDSVLARSELPGANAVGRALGESESAARREARRDSLTR